MQMEMEIVLCNVPLWP